MKSDNLFIAALVFIFWSFFALIFSILGSQNKNLTLDNAARKKALTAAWEGERQEREAKEACFDSTGTCLGNLEECSYLLGRCVHIEDLSWICRRTEREVP